MWKVEYTDAFEEWWVTLTVAAQSTIDDAVLALHENGPALGRGSTRSRRRAIPT